MNRRHLIGWLALAALAAFVVIGAYSSPPKHSSEASTFTTSTASTSTPSRPGAASVYSAIDASGDCAELQRMFNTAGDNHDRESAAHNLTLMRVATSYMTAADDRMRALGCY